MALPIYVPIAYILVLLVSLSTFSRIYRRRSASRVAGGVNAQPWFPEGHPERDIYMSLVAAAASASDGEEESEGEGEKGQVQKKEGNDKISDTVLKAALLNRAMADVRRIIRMRDDKQALSALLQKGSLGDETMERFALAEKELEAEILDVVSEANTFKEGWGQIIFPTASEMVAHLKHKEAYYGIQAQRQEETQKLEKAGKPIPKPTIEMPPLVTPPGTTIQVQQGPQPNGASGPPATITAGSPLNPGPLPAPPPGPQQQQPGGPGPGQSQIPLQLPPHIAQMIAQNGGQITPPMLPMIAQANGGQLPPQLIAAIQQAQMAQQMQMQQQQGQQGQQVTQGQNGAGSPAAAAAAGPAGAGAGSSPARPPIVQGQMVEALKAAIQRAKQNGASVENQLKADLAGKVSGTGSSTAGSAGSGGPSTPSKNANKKSATVEDGEE